MIVSGIVAEYNPFHTGHRYLLEQAQGVKIVAMSGNFVQRGEPAIIDKWTRAQMALEHGADVVVELPFLVAVQSADYFATGSVAILEKLGVHRLVFGTEQVLDYQTIAQLYESKKEAMGTYLAELPNHLSYPQKTQAMWSHFAGLAFTGETPNHILALAYAKAVAETGIILSPIQRQGAGFHSEEMTEAYASATAIRKAAEQIHLIRSSLPSPRLFEAASKVRWEDYFLLLRYQILTHPNLTTICQVNDELANRIRVAIREVRTVEELIERIATKRYTKARIRRVLTYILVHAQETPLPESIHVLGFTKKGQSHLKQLKGQVQLVTRIGKEPWDSVTQRADAIYQLGNPALAEQTYGRQPIRL